MKNPNFNSNNYPTMWTGIDGTDTYPYGGSPTTEGQYHDSTAPTTRWTPTW